MERNVGLFNESFPPVMDGVAVCVENYARWIQEKVGGVSVVTPRKLNAKYGQYPYEVLDYASVPVPFRHPYVTGIAQIDPLLRAKLYRRRFKIVQIIHDRIDGAGYPHLFQPGMHGICAERLPVGSQDEIRRAPENRISPNLAADNGIPKRFRIKIAQITKHFRFVRTFQPLRKAAVLHIVLDGRFPAQLGGVVAKFFVNKRTNAQRGAVPGKIPRRLRRQKRRSAPRNEKRNPRQRQSPANDAPIRELLYVVKKDITCLPGLASSPMNRNIAGNTFYVPAFFGNRRVGKVYINDLFPLRFQFVSYLPHEDGFSRLSYARDELYAVVIIKRTNPLYIAFSLQHNTSLLKIFY